jgi:hypothetical protein
MAVCAIVLVTPGDSACARSTCFASTRHCATMTRAVILYHVQDSQR